MGIYIKGMEMPRHCNECAFTEYGNGETFCYHTGISILCNVGRQNGCPLTEVSEPHGRLIDADAVMRNNLFTERDRGFLNDAPTVIESEVEE